MASKPTGLTDFLDAHSRRKLNRLVNTITITAIEPASGSQTLAWNGQGELTGADVTGSGASVGSYVYDAEGNLFAQTDSGG
ncbi:MAG TPA: hypothetical protein VMG38_01025, partial [Trebonia sp.]|nr:hypothetical protein [Trebonia sp.]